MNPELIAILASWAGMLAGYPAPNVVVEYVPHEFFVERVCNGRKCTKVEGAYLDADAPGTVFIDQRWEGNQSIVAKGLIVHEMVHAAQYQSGKFESQNCDDSLRRERQAFYVQDQFLIAHGHRPPLRFTAAVCAK